MRFLVIRLSSIGDVVHALPAVSALGATFPQAQITWVIEARYAGLLAGNPFVHETIALDTLGWRTRLGHLSTFRDVLRSMARLRGFDTTIDFQGLLKSALIARLSHAPRRIGFQRKWLREPLAATFYTDRAQLTGGEHVVEESMALVEHAGAKLVPREHWQFPLPTNPADTSSVEARLQLGGIDEFMIVNPGGGWTAKRWAPTNYAELIRSLACEVPWRILVTGSAQEEDMVREILDGAKTHRASYFPSNLTEFIALARRARLFVGGDSGPLHLAAAVGTPIVGVYGPTSPARNGPFAPSDITLSGGGPIDHTRRGKNPSYISGVAVRNVRAAILQRLAVAHG